MKFRLSNLLLIVAMVAVAFGWYCDRARLVSENAKLNAECVELFKKQVVVIYDGDTTTRSTSYYPDLPDPEDRARYVRASN